MKNTPENITSQLQEKDQRILQLESTLAQMEAVLEEKENQLKEKENLLTESLTQIGQKDSEIDQMNAKIMGLEWRLSSLQRALFASKSERIIPMQNPSQLTLELGVEATEAPEIKKEKISYERCVKSTKKSHSREPLPASLPRKIKIIEPENIPEGAVKINEKKIEKLCLIPPRIYVLCLVLPIYSVKVASQPNQTNDDPSGRTVLVAPSPYDPFPRFNAHVSLMAWLFVSKFVDHLPFYRIAQILHREDYNVSQSTLNDWFSAVCRKLHPLYEYLQKQILQTNYLQIDESPIKVQTHDKPGSTHQGYMWVVNDPVRHLTCFLYRPGRGGVHITPLLQNYEGYIQTDGYKVYEMLSGLSQGKITLMACLTHARRKFFEAKTSNQAFSDKALALFAPLYQVEQHARENNLSADQIKILRRHESAKHLDSLYAWLIEQQKTVLPKSPEGKAVGYTLGLWDKLKIYLEQGYLQIDNNQIENAIRPLAIGRKNYLFAGSHSAAERIAMAYSFMSICKLNNLNPQQWLTDTLMQIDVLKPSQYHTLFPQSKAEK